VYSSGAAAKKDYYRWTKPSRQLTPITLSSEELDPADFQDHFSI
jgi:hypothetical protein